MKKIQKDTLLTNTLPDIFFKLYFWKFKYFTRSFVISHSRMFVSDRLQFGHGKYSEVSMIILIGLIYTCIYICNTNDVE
jgi:hypothetical protein